MWHWLDVFKSRERLAVDQAFLHIPPRVVSKSLACSEPLGGWTFPVPLRLKDSVFSASSLNPPDF